MRLPIVKPNDPSAALQPGEVQIWHTSFEPSSEMAADSPLLLDGVLSEDELAYATKCLAPRKSEFVTARHGLRRLLSHYFPDVAPEGWIFSTTEFGKPFLTGPVSVGDFCFNVSHSKGAVIFAFSRAQALGVDIEARTQSNSLADSLADVASAAFSPREVRALQALGPERMKTRFFDFWTLKEAFIKAVGMGLSLDTTRFTFEISDVPSSIQFDVDPQISWTGDNWQFALLGDQPGYQVAVALRDARRPPLRLVDQGTLRPVHSRSSKAA